MSEQPEPRSAWMFDDFGPNHLLTDIQRVNMAWLRMTLPIQRGLRAIVFWLARVDRREANR